MHTHDRADFIIPGLPKLEAPAFAPPSFERKQWADRLNREQKATGKPCRIRYTHGSPGGYDRNGIFRYFGGGMVFSAWCDCGRFRYDGDETCRRWAVKAHRTWAALTTNDVVTYYGPKYTGREFVIAAADKENGTLTLEDVEWGDIRLTGVRRSYVESAGRTWVPRTCSHPRHLRRSIDGVCCAYQCAG